MQIRAWGQIASSSIVAKQSIQNEAMRGIFPIGMLHVRRPLQFHPQRSVQSLEDHPLGGATDAEERICSQVEITIFVIMIILHLLIHPSKLAEHGGESFENAQQHFFFSRTSEVGDAVRVMRLCCPWFIGRCVALSGLTKSR